MRRGLTIALAGCLLAGCYRIAGPPPLPDGLSLRVVVDDARLPAAQLHLHEAVAEALHRRLGWQVRPDGAARLDLALETERIRSTGDDDRGVPARWSVRLDGTALLATGRTNRVHRFTGEAFYGSLADEPAALAAAAAAAAADLATWLESQR